MAPAHPRVQQQQQQQQQQRDPSDNAEIAEHGLFLEPMMGTPLAMYVHKDVSDHDRVLDLITVSSCPGDRRSARSFLVKTRFSSLVENGNSCQ